MDKNFTQIQPVKNKENICKKTTNRSMISVAIDKNDEDYIVEFIRNGKFEDIDSLSKQNKCKLAQITVKHIKGDYKLDAINLLYYITRDVGNIENIVKQLKDIQIDFNKLIYLKGRIDYLKHQNKNKK